MVQTESADNSRHGCMRTLPWRLESFGVSHLQLTHLTPILGEQLNVTWTRPTFWVGQFCLQHLLLVSDNLIADSLKDLHMVDPELLRVTLDLDLIPVPRGIRKTKEKVECEGPATSVMNASKQEQTSSVASSFESPPSIAAQRRDQYRRPGSRTSGPVAGPSGHANRSPEPGVYNLASSGQYGPRADERVGHWQDQWDKSQSVAPNITQWARQTDQATVVAPDDPPPPAPMPFDEATAAAPPNYPPPPPNAGAHNTCNAHYEELRRMFGTIQAQLEQRRGTPPPVLEDPPLLLRRGPHFPILPRKRTGEPKRQDALVLQLARLVRKQLREIVSKPAQIQVSVTRDERDEYESMATENDQLHDPGDARIDNQKHIFSLLPRNTNTVQWLEEVQYAFFTSLPTAASLKTATHYFNISSSHHRTSARNVPVTARPCTRKSGCLLDSKWSDRTSPPALGQRAALASAESPMARS
ncbi:hypothetical protein DFH06DRAFT_1154378 [Mycena polygramma]|nr:hypothetical protein DFH06DRAFT_1154378 [Mycena polygramma]